LFIFRPPEAVGEPEVPVLCASDLDEAAEEVEEAEEATDHGIDNDEGWQDNQMAEDWQDAGDENVEDQGSGIFE
jgi:hypothetical protein